MNILLLAQNLHGKDGWSRYAKDVAYALSLRGDTVTVLVETVAKDIGWCKQIACLRPPLHCLSNRGIIIQLFRLWRALRQCSPDIIHVICEPYALPLGLIPHCRPTVITIHGSYAVIPWKKGLLCRMLMKRACRQARAIISVSHFTKNFLRLHEPTCFSSLQLEKKITVLHNAIAMGEHTRFIDHPEQSAVTSIIGVGAVKKRKGYIEAIRALAVFQEKYAIPFRYDIIGSISDQAYVMELRSLITELHLDNSIRIRGVLSEQELIDSYEHADLFLLLSLAEGMYVEGFVLAFLEAASRGVPCIGPTTGGCPEAIDNGKTGFVCDPHNPVAISDAIHRILAMNAINRTDCRKWAEDHDIQRATDHIVALYEDARRET